MGNRHRWRSEELEFLNNSPQFKYAYSNSRARVLVLQFDGRKLNYPFALLNPRPSLWDYLVRSYKDESHDQAIGYELKSGKRGILTLDQLRSYFREPSNLKQQVLLELTFAAMEGLDETELSGHQIVRRLHTSASQLYRIMDPHTLHKSVDGLLALLEVLGYNVEVTTRPKIT